MRKCSSVRACIVKAHVWKLEDGLGCQSHLLPCLRQGVSCLHTQGQLDHSLLGIFLSLFPISWQKCWGYTQILIPFLGLRFGQPKNTKIDSLTPIIPAKQEDCPKFEASLDYSVRPCLKTKAKIIS